MANPLNSILTPPRPVYDPSQLSKRQRIMMFFEDAFLAARQYEDGYQTTWTAVSRKPLTKQEIQSGNAIAFYDVNEAKTPQMQFFLCDLTVFVEFYHTMAIGEHAADVLNQMLTDVQRKLREDITCGGLSYNLLERKNQIDVDGPLEKVVNGVVEFVVTYRHAVDDPRR